MRSTTLFLIIAIFLVVIGYFAFSSGSGFSGGDKSSGNVQKIVLSIKNYNYYPNTIKVKVNQPVSISLDSSVGGCLRSFVVPDFGVSKYLATPKDTVEFTPTKEGTFQFRCSMGMGTGTLIVE